MKRGGSQITTVQSWGVGVVAEPPDLRVWPWPCPLARAQVLYDENGSLSRAGGHLAGPLSLFPSFPSSDILQYLSSFLHLSGGFHDNVLTGLQQNDENKSNVGLLLKINIFNLKNESVF